MGSMVDHGNDVVGIGGIRKEDYDDLDVEDEDDHSTFWDDIINPPEHLTLDLGVLLDMGGPDSSSSSPPSPPEALVSISEASLSIGQIEDFLFNDDNDDHDHDDPPQLLAAAADDFLSGLLIDPCDPTTTAATTSPDNSDNNLSFSPDIACLQQNHSSPPLSDHPQPPLEASKDSLDESQEPKQQPTSSQLVEEEEEEEVEDADDPLSKKRKRQMRNRDAAVRSRERKKMYVRDLELKSRHYESECRRLGMLLQCYVAENHALRLSLHNSSSKAFGPSTTKQESAVLLLESLLLGSLLWFLLGVIGLLILPQQLLSVVEAAETEKNLASPVPGEGGSNIFETLELEEQSFMRSKRCRGSRRKMRWGVVQGVVIVS